MNKPGFIHRLFDFAIAGTAVILLSPVFLLLTLLTLYFHGRPAFFRQQRAGYGGIPFQMLKFRSMTNERDEHGELLPDLARLTKFGKFLRSTSFDELPELFNVLRGEMSIVGPRPLLEQYLIYYTSEQMKRHRVRPGITGWAQINGRNAISWDEKFALDLWYVENRTVWLDVKIIFLTIKSILKREGIDSGADTTMPVFRGSGKID